MATIVNNVRFSDNAKELAANLQAGIGTLDVMKTSVDRTVQSLGGTGLYGAANKITAAIQELGGVTKLTAAEQERANATLDKAIDKYSAMGQVAPQAMVDMAAALKAAQSPLEELGHKSDDLKEKLAQAFENPGGAAKSFASSIVSDIVPAMGSVGVAVGAATAVIGLAGVELMKLGTEANVVGAQIGRMSSQFNIPVQNVSNLRFAVKAAGGDFDTFGDSMFTFQKRIEDNGDAVDKGLKKIGLSVATLKEMRPDEQFLAISDAVRASGAEVNKSAVAFEIFGKQGKDILPLLTKPLSDLADESERLGDTWSDRDVAAARAFRGEITKMATETEEAWTSLGRTVSPITNEITLAWERTKLAFANAVVLIATSGDSLMNFIGLSKDWALSAETAAAKQDTINKAIAEGAPATIKYGDAVRYLNEQWERSKPAQDQANDSAQAWLKHLGEGILAANRAKDADEKLTEGLAEQGIVRGEGIDAINAYTAAQKKAADEAKHLAETLDDTTTINATVETSFQDLTFKVDNYGTHVEQMTTSARDYLHNHRDEIQGVVDAMNALDAVETPFAAITLPSVASGLLDLKSPLEQITDGLLSFSDGMIAMESNLRHLAQVSGGAFGGMVKDLATMVETMKLSRDSAEKFTDAFYGGDKGGMAAGAVGMAGSLVSATGPNSNKGTVGGEVEGAASGALSGMSAGAAIGSIVPGIGTAIGAAVGAIAGGIVGFVRNMGVSAAESAGRVVEGDFEKSYGGFAGMMSAIGEAYAATGRSAAQAQSDVAALIAAEKQGGPAVQAMIDTINVAFAEQKKHAADVSTAVDGVLAAAKATGGGFPASMQPALDQLLTMNGLTDDEKTALKGLSDTGKPSFDELSTAAGHYGLSLDEVGGKVPQLSITHQADQIAQDYNELVTESGADSDKVLAGMKDSLNQLVQHAMDTGSVLPTSLQPMIDQLLKTGQLTDTAGNKIDSLGDLKFDDTGDPLAKSLTTLTDALNHLGQILSGLPSQASSAAQGISGALNQVQAPSFQIHYSYVADNAPDTNYAALGGFVGRYGIQHFAAGGIVAGLGLGPVAWPTQGTDVVPAMLTPHERVLTVQQNEAYEQLLHAPDAPAVSGLGAPPADTSTSADVQGEIAKLRNDMARRDLDMPRNFARAVRDLGPDVKRR